MWWDGWNVTETSLTEKFCFSHCESQWDRSTIKISMKYIGSWFSMRFCPRTWIIIQNLIENQKPYEEPKKKSISWARPYWDSHWDSQWRFFFLLENLNAVLHKILIFDEVLDKVLDSLILDTQFLWIAIFHLRFVSDKLTMRTYLFSEMNPSSARWSKGSGRQTKSH